MQQIALNCGTTCPLFTVTKPFDVSKVDQDVPFKSLCDVSLLCGGEEKIITNVVIVDNKPASSLKSL